MRKWPVAKGRRAYVRGQPNKTELKYSAELSLQKAAGLITEFWFEGIKLRLANNTFYTPDFFVMLPSGELEFHEVKGHWEDDARVKIKVAASLYPFRFVGVWALPKRDGGGWKIEEF